MDDPAKRRTISYGVHKTQALIFRQPCRQHSSISAINKIRNEAKNQESSNNETESEIPLSAAYAERPQDPLGIKQEMNPSPEIKNIKTQITNKVTPLPLVKNLKQVYHYEEKQKNSTTFAVAPMDEGYFSETEHAYPGDSSEIPPGNQVGNGRSSINHNGITNHKSLIELAPIERASYEYPPYRFGYFGRRRIPYLPLKALEFSLLNEAIYKIKNENESEIPLSTAYLDRPRHPLGSEQETKPSPVNKNIEKRITYKHPNKVIPPPLVRSLGSVHHYKEKQKERTLFAMTPMDEGYFSPTQLVYSDVTSISTSERRPELGEKKRNENVRDIRQNPIPKNAKTLVAEDLEKLRQGVISDNFETTAKPVDVFNKYFRGAPSYWVVISAALTITVVLVISMIVYGFFVLVKRAKAAAAVDYPAYGVTGPTPDISGDCRLAHSAQMYHYQHKKQQMLAMEKIVVEQREGSLSGPESEEENEEGDYTVYECPGFAMTGDMEVNNPLFDEPTPATPGVVHVFQTKPKE